MRATALSAILLAIISLAATAAGGAIALGQEIASLPTGMPTNLELLWWTLSGINAGLAASTALAYRRLGNGSLRHRAVAALSATALTVTAGLWGFLAVESFQ